MIKKQDGSVLVVFFLTEKCNLNCKYCYTNQTNATMSWDVCENGISFISSLPYEDKTLCFLGGEPLVEWELVKKVVDSAQQKGISKFNLCTNLLLLDKEKMDFFENNNFNLMLSIDGDKPAHDSERISKSGGSFEEVNKQISLVKDSKVKFTVQMCVSPENVKHLSNSFDYLVKQGIANTTIYLVPIVDSNWSNDNFQKFKEQSKKILKSYKDIKKEFPECRVVFGKCCSPNSVEELYDSRKDQTELCLCKDRYYGVDVKGDIYYCFFAGFSKYKEKCEKYKLGDVWKGITEENKLSAFTGEGMDRCMSCLAWNHIVNDDVRQPAEAYKQLYTSWLSNWEELIQEDLN